MIATRPHFNERGNEFFQWLPEDATRLVVTYLGREGEGRPSRSSSQEDREVVRVAGICKGWQRDLVLRYARDWAVARVRHVRLFQAGTQEMFERAVERQYPPQMVKLCRRYGIHIGRLPILGLREGELGLESEDIALEKMTSPVMRFWKEGTLGIAFHLQHQEERIVTIGGARIGFPGRQSVLAIYKNFMGQEPGKWRFTWVRKLSSLSVGTRYGFYKEQRDSLIAHLSCILSDRGDPYGIGGSLPVDHAFLSQTLSGQGRHRIYSPADRSDSRYRVVAFTHRYPQVALLAIQLAVIAGVALAYVAMASRRLLEMEIAIP